MGIPEQIRGDNPFISLEFFPPRTTEAVPAFCETVERLMRLKPLFAAVTCGAGGGGATTTLQTARDLAEQYGITVMPHVTCVRNSVESVESLVAEIRECGFRNVLAVRGDFPEGQESAPEGLQYASDLVRRIRELDTGLNVGVAAYPDAHPESPSIESDIDSLLRKFESGASFAVTQLFFDNRKYFDLVERLARKGCSRLVIPSVLPIRSLGQVRRLMKICSTPIPGKLLAALEEADARGGDAAVREVGADYAAAQVRSLVDQGAPGVHLYPFNRAGLCLDVVERAGLLP
ncbi:methylenetetrahydrofolate reductase [Salidesulfovibrio onnuriiensis]|uniref:methylenetetrahydrofolate reductase n=1 Tax=Salidesulfovibrio onnuriiensis TaxID=2583823 RepID=UPI0011C7AB1A|nr:methylenetetrahydrofolate reductase [Salidesulfovibrio onnuriiensis]